MVYNEYDARYKDPFGAVRAGQTVRFCITPPQACNEAWLSIWQDGQGSPSLFALAKTDGGFATEQSFAQPGVYFYAFVLDDDSTIYRNMHGEPSFQREGEFFQLTVYAADYVQPTGFTGGILYQIFPDRFAIGSAGIRQTPFADRVLHTTTRELPVFRPDADGVVRNNDYFGGNLEGIREKLPYLQSLGVTCIYLNPIGESHSNHRYDTACYRRVDPLLGDETEFVELCKAAHHVGIKVILDGVFSHTGDDSEYFNKYGRYQTLGAYQSPDSPYYKWYKFHAYPDDYQSWWGFRNLPEIIEEEPSFDAYICGEGGVIDYWIGLGADGFRLDVADELPDDFIEHLRAAIKRNGDDKILIGEVWEDASNKISYGTRRRFLYGNALDAVMNYPFRNAILDFVKHGNAGVFLAWIETIVGNYPRPMLDIMMNLLSTHDTERAINVLAVGGSEGMSREQQAGVYLGHDEYLRGVEMLKLAMVLQFTLPGIPCIYYGDEIGMQGMRDPFNRAFMQWENADENLLEFTRELAAIRRAHPAFADGEFVPIYAANATVAYLRRSAAETVAVVLNRSDQERTVVINAQESVTVKPWSYEICAIAEQ